LVGENKMTADVVDFNDYKYTRIAKEFVRLRNESPSAAAQYAREQVPAEKFSVLSKYIELELIKIGEFEPHEE